LSLPSLKSCSFKNKYLSSHLAEPAVRTPQAHARNGWVDPRTRSYETRVGWWTAPMGRISSGDGL